MKDLCHEKSKDLHVKTSDNSIAGVPIENTKDSVKKGKLIIIYGEPGSGKTTLAGTIQDSPYGTPELYLDCEGGTDSIAHRSIDKVQLDTWPKSEKVIKQLLRDCTYRSITLDHLSKLIDRCLRDIKMRRPNVRDPRQWYAELTDLIVPIISDLQDLAWKNEIVVLIIMQQAEIEEFGTNIRKRTLSATPKILEKILGVPDIIGNLRAEGDSARSTEFVNRLSFVGSATALAKFRRPQNAVSMSIPKEIWNPSMAPILDCLIGGVTFPTEQYQKPKRIQAQEAERERNASS